MGWQELARLWICFKVESIERGDGMEHERGQG